MTTAEEEKEEEELLLPSTRVRTVRQRQEQVPLRGEESRDANGATSIRMDIVGPI